MINCIQKSFRRIVAQSRIPFLTQPKLILEKKVSLNYNPQILFSMKKQLKHITIDDFGIMAQLDSNINENIALQEWQQDIVTQIEKYSNTSDQIEMIDFLLYIQGFYSTYMNCWIKNPEQIVQIDKQISEFLKIELQDQFYSDESQKNYIHLILLKLRIQAILLQNFETTELSQKIQLYQQYQFLHQNTLEIEGANRQMIKIQSCLNSSTLFTYLAKKWKQYNEEPKKNYLQQIELVKYALDQLVKIFDQLQTGIIQNQQKLQVIEISTNHQNFVFDNFRMFQFVENYELILDVVLKTEMAYQKFMKIIPLENFISQKQHFILKYINLGQTDKALQSALDIYDLRSQFSSKQALSYYITYYYCLRQTENNGYNLDNSPQNLNLQGLDQVDQNQYDHLILIQQLHSLIAEQQYELMQPIIIKIISLPFETYAQKQLLFPLLCDAIIFNPQNPNQFQNSKLLLSYIVNEDFPIDSIYLTIMRDVQKSMLLFIISLATEDKNYLIFSLMIQYMLDYSKGNANVERQIITSVLKFIPSVVSDKTYKLLEEVLNYCISYLQKNKEKPDNLELLEILNQQKINLKQKLNITEFKKS